MSRREVGVSARMVERVGAVFSIVYEVTEARRDREGVPFRWRYRMEHGQDIRQASAAHIGTHALLEVVAKGAEALASIARAEDKKAQKKRGATSRRKGR